MLNMLDYRIFSSEKDAFDRRERKHQVFLLHHRRVYRYRRRILSDTSIEFQIKLRGRCEEN